MPKRLTKEEFISISKNKHGSLYDYTQVNYKNNATKVSIFCRQCRNTFHQQPCSHMNGSGCAICGSKKCRKSKTLTTQEYIRRCSKKHANRYDYSLVAYTHNTCQVTIICPKHGAFNQEAYTHLRGRGCQLCATNNYSRKALQWLNAISEKQNICIQHIDNGGEFRIPGTKFKADGFCTETNTVFEFYGDIWHGNPDKFSPTDKCHPFRDVVAGTLYKQTMERENKIRSLGFNLVTIWESEFDLSFKPSQTDF